MEKPLSFRERLFYYAFYLYNRKSMAAFDDKEQNKKIQDIRAKEEEAFTEKIAKKFDLPYIDLTGATIETDALSKVKEEDARKALLAPFKIVGKDLYVALKSPNLPETKRVLGNLEKDYNLGIHLASQRSLEKAWGRYEDITFTFGIEGGVLDISEEEIKKLAAKIKTNQDIAFEFDRVLALGEERKVTRLMEIIFAGAIATDSSDVHIEAQDGKVRLRFRQDGVLQDIIYFDPATYKQILSRIKLLSEMKLTQTENAQDGRFTIDYDKKEIEIRVSVVPGAFGESFVMRILNPDGIKVGVEHLGIEKRLYEILLKEIEKPNGMILTTGPTGSGKTTTLYSFINKVYSPEVKILTIEDPIEYRIEGINQTQVNRQKGYTFSSGLRAALRQDPDIIMVGEIRDSETASIAVNASLTGHLVLSTLHTNSAAGVIPRLLDLGVSPQILAAALSVSIAQRLVRKVCESCKEIVAPTPEQEGIIRDILREAQKNEKPLHEYGISVNQKIELSRGKGCEVCNGTGYKGRIGLFEAIITDEYIEELLNKSPSEQEIRRVAEKQRLLNIREDGVVKILNGITSFEEVQKVIDLDIKNITQFKSDAEPSQGENISLVNEESNIPQQNTFAEIPESSKPISQENKEEENLENLLEEVSKKIDLVKGSVAQSKKIIPEEGAQISQIPPAAILNNKSIEISLLIDYLRRLEQDQILRPDVDISKQIKQVQLTILELLQRKQAESILNAQGNFAQAHKTYTELADELDTLYREQLQNPGVDMSERIKKIREEIEYYHSQQSI